MSLSTETNHPKFMFGVTFEDAAPLSPLEALRHANSEQRVDLLVSEFEAAKAQSYADGVNAGKAEASSSQESQLNGLLSAIGSNLANLAQNNEVRRKLNDETVALAIRAIAQKLLPSMVAQNGLAEIEALAVRVITELREEPRLVIRVADMHAAACAARLPEIAKKMAFPGQLIILGEPALGPADCRVEWADGGMERLESALWSEIDKSLGKHTNGGMTTHTAAASEYQHEQQLLNTPAPTTDITVPTEGDTNGR